MNFKLYTGLTRNRTVMVQWWPKMAIKIVKNILVEVKEYAAVATLAAIAVKVETIMIM